MVQILVLSFRDVFRPELRGLLFRAAGIAALVLFLLWAGLQWLAGASIALPHAWLDGGLTILASLGLFLIAIYFVPAATSLVAGLFLDDIARRVEVHHYGPEAEGKAMDLLPAMVTSVQFTLVVIIMNLVALVLLLVPGINAIIFLLVNGYLLGREYFELAVLRHVGKQEARRLRQRHGFTLFLLGLAVAGYLAIPLLNLTAPLFATAVMVHFAARLRERGQLGPQAVLASNRHTS